MRILSRKTARQKATREAASGFLDWGHGLCKRGPGRVSVEATAFGLFQGKLSNTTFFENCHSARIEMRHQLVSLHYWCGLPCIFLTVNPADVHHPFTLFFSTGAGLQPVAPPDIALALRQKKLAQLIARDPVAAVRAFHQHLRLLFKALLGCALSPAELPVDGVADLGNSGIFGQILAAFGAIEPQTRGSLHIHMLLYVYGCRDSPSLL